MAFMMFRIICAFCDWKVPITQEVDASYARNFQAAHFLDHVSEMTGDLLVCAFCQWTYHVRDIELTYAENIYADHLIGHVEEIMTDD